MIWVAPTLVALAWLLATPDHPSRFAAKPLASLGFVLVAVSGAPHADRFGWLVVAGLVLSAMGDVALMADRGFLIGVAAFGAAHLAYVAAFVGISPPTAPAVAIAVAVGLLAGRWVLPHTAGVMRIAVGGYIAVISAMLATALSIAPTLPIVTAGAVAFVVSDLAVARERFVASDHRNRLWGLPLYYAGQLLIASSVAG